MLKKSVFGIMILLAGIMLVFGMIGCDNPNNNSDLYSTMWLINATRTGSLKKLTADLAAASSGDTITLASNIILIGSLTVPAGVTLDITAPKAALILEDSAVLTVNGTVNAKATTGVTSYGIVIMPGGTHTATINGSGVIHLKTQGSLLTIGSGQKLILDGNVTLDGLYKVADGGADPDDTINNIYSLVWVGGELDMRGGKITGNYNSDTTQRDGGGVEVSMETGGEVPTFTMSGNAEVSGNKAAQDGGGVNVCLGATFIMKDSAKVSDNTAGRYGGGVRVRQDVLPITYPATSFTLESGTVTGNTASGLGYSLYVYSGTAKWGATSTSITGGNGGQSPGGNIISGGTGYTNDNLSAVGP